jgi:hypothetical protein
MTDVEFRRCFAGRAMLFATAYNVPPQVLSFSPIACPFALNVLYCVYVD